MPSGANRTSATKLSGGEAEGKKKELDGARKERRPPEVESFPAREPPPPRRAFRRESPRGGDEDGARGGERAAAGLSFEPPRDAVAPGGIVGSAACPPVSTTAAGPGAAAAVPGSGADEEAGEGAAAASNSLVAGGDSAIEIPNAFLVEDREEVEPPTTTTEDRGGNDFPPAPAAVATVVGDKECCGVVLPRFAWFLIVASLLGTAAAIGVGVAAGMGGFGGGGGGGDAAPSGPTTTVDDPTVAPTMPPRTVTVDPTTTDALAPTAAPMVVAPPNCLLEEPPPDTVPAQWSKLVAPDGEAGDFFGYSVDVSGDTVVVGAFGDGGDLSGSIYVYVRRGAAWVRQGKLIPDDDDTAYDRFGHSVAVSGDTIVVGAYWRSEKGAGSGAAYVYAREGEAWTQQAKIVPTDGAAGDEFGSSVAISGDTIVVSAHRDDNMNVESGSVYVYTYRGNMWVPQSKLIPDDGEAHDWFGHSIAVSGDTIVVGAYRDDDGGEASGSAYVYAREGETWMQQSKIVRTDGKADDRFGWSVATDGEIIVVGAPEEYNEGGSKSGSAYIYGRHGKTWHAELVPTDGYAHERFGFSVAVGRKTVIVGAPWDSDKGEGSGAVYVFALKGIAWVQEAKIVPADGKAGDEFGFSLAMDGNGNTAVIGADSDNNYGADYGDKRGSAYTIELC